MSPLRAKYSTKTRTFTSDYRHGGWITNPSEEVVKNEPMLHRASLMFARENGGPITRAFIEQFMVDIEEQFDVTKAHARSSLMSMCVIDTRVHMLMRGWWPCIPGWHHDDVERTQPDGQPNYDNQTYRAKHCVMIAGADVSKTEFATGTSVFSNVPVGGGNVYGRWTDEVDDAIEDGDLHWSEAEMGRLIHMDDRTWHRGAQSTGSGWRFFGRISYNTARAKNPANEIRRQTQVYLRDTMAGW